MSILTLLLYETSRHTLLNCTVCAPGAQCGGSNQSDCEGGQCTSPHPTAALNISRYACIYVLRALHAALRCAGEPLSAMLSPCRKFVIQGRACKQGCLRCITQARAKGWCQHQRTSMGTNGMASTHGIMRSWCMALCLLQPGCVITGSGCSQCSCVAQCCVKVWQASLTITIELVSICMT